ncbi:hypothetical protein AGMMS4956_18820 [Bacteroidia bacterium]|nr:hypothetical protein AGMMS4956_18820 [Bacteroidia bacterium]
MKKNFIFTAIASLITIAAINSCTVDSTINDNNSTDDSATNNNNNNNLPNADMKGIYMAGQITNANLGIRQAALCKDGVLQVLSQRNSEATSVCVAGSDVYVVGYEYDELGLNQYLTLWKNGIAQQLWQSAGNPNLSIFVLGNDVYITEESAYYYIKNGVKQTLPDNTTGLIKMCISGNDIYLYLYDSVKRTYILLKNGVEQSIPDDYDYLYFLFVSGNDVYFGGKKSFNQYDNRLILWKNGVAQTISGRIDDLDRIWSLWVLGSDVYFVTEEDEYLYRLRKNGQIVMEWRGAPKVFYVLGNDVYWFEFDNERRLLKNGIEIVAVLPTGFIKWNDSLFIVE